MSKKRDPFQKRDVRIHQNPVTGEPEVTVLDDVQLAFERCTQTIEGQMLKFGSDNAKSVRLAKKLAEWLAQKQPHSDAA